MRPQPSSALSLQNGCKSLCLSQAMTLEGKRPGGGFFPQAGQLQTDMNVPRCTLPTPHKGTDLLQLQPLLLTQWLSTYEPWSRNEKHQEMSVLKHCNPNNLTPISKSRADTKFRSQ